VRSDIRALDTFSARTVRNNEPSAMRAALSQASDPNDEPASVLLERIRAESANVQEPAALANSSKLTPDR
jgi:hypothetical protein